MGFRVSGVGCGVLEGVRRSVRSPSWIKGAGLVWGNGYSQRLVQTIRQKLYTYLMPYTILRLREFRDHGLGTTGRCSGSYKWGFESPHMGYRYSHPTYNPTYMYV